MLKKAITYKDLDGNTLTEDFYFHLNKPEVVKIRFLGDKDLEETMKDVIKHSKGETIINLLETIIGRAYGERSPNGKTFMKSDEIWLNFFHSDAYSELFNELVQDSDAMANFIRATVPADLGALIDQAKAEDVELPAEPAPQAPPAPALEPWIAEDRDATTAELQTMTPQQLQIAYQQKEQRKQQKLEAERLRQQYLSGEIDTPTAAQ